MSAVLYPVAANAAAALSAPLGRAARASEAKLLAGGEVAFVTEPVGPAFTTREAGLDAFARRVDDERSGGGGSVPPENRYCELRELAQAPPPKPGKANPPRPIYRDGRRWAEPPPPPATLWRLSVRYWKLVGAGAEPILEHPPERPSTRKRAAAPHDIQALRDRLGRPLTPIKPQQPLDVGLFEFRPPEAPHILMPDE
jgi:hypothetical protein